MNHLDRMPKDCYTIPIPPLEVNGLNNGISPIDDTLFNTLCPINPLTGHRDDMLSRLFSGQVSDTEKQLIVSQLVQIKGVSSPKDLTDDDILSIIPSRYLSDPVELDRYRDFVDDLRNIDDSTTLDTSNNFTNEPEPTTNAVGSPE